MLYDRNQKPICTGDTVSPVRDYLLLKVGEEYDVHKWGPRSRRGLAVLGIPLDEELAQLLVVIRRADGLPA